MAEAPRSRLNAAALATAALVIPAVTLVYGRALDAPFIFDDRLAIVENPSTERLWPLVGDADRRGPLNPPPLAPTARRPLVNLSFALDRHVAGLDPRWYHAVNLAWHAAAALLLAAVVRRTLRLPRFAADPAAAAAAPLAAAAALVWAVHPLATEAVVYVTQRTELMAAAASLAVLYAAIRYWTAASPAGRRRAAVGAGLACIAGAAAKEIVVLVPFVVLLYERTFVADSWRACRRSWPLYASLAGGWLLLALLNAGPIGGLSDARHRVPLPVWWLTQTKVLLLYLKLALWPAPLTIHYAPRYLRTLGEAWPWIAAAAAVAAGTAAVVWRRPSARFAVAAALAALAPTFLIPLPKMMAAERRMYLPLAALVTLAVVGGHRAVAGRGAAVVRIGAALVVALVLAYALASVRRLAAYETAVAIWTDAVRHQPDDAMAHYNLGVALLEERDAPADARRHFTAALRLDPEHTGALVNLGMVLNRAGRPEEARALFERALAIDPDDVVARNNLGAVLTTLGRGAEALPHLERALAIESAESQATLHRNLGKALLQTGRTADALRHLEAAVRHDPRDVEAQADLGAARLRAGEPAAALAAFERALALRPDDPELHTNLASALLQSGRPDEAIARYERALAIAPDYASAHNNLGTALMSRGRGAEAIAHFEAALRERPDYVGARYNLGSALLEAGRPVEAAGELEQAVRASPEDPQLRFRLAAAAAAAGRREEAVSHGAAALALARAVGNEVLARAIEDWLSERRAPSP